ncbi:hypothetical protein DIS18_09710 [Algibacter marinivivus]|uniref:Uncharacterized protein n=1 Tax=Algibacter marinivivus TaxID=2100723 RepID=A0A2U2X403_9FLAO|nr:hypothetical protein [Algibacter marinivivus]PWH82516.1 hypothetical protein DIS18_09710 [Algibacter marinivivus]
MKKILYLLYFVCGVSFATTSTDLNNNDPKVGDVLKIKQPKSVSFKHIHFPRLNFIVKRGGLANYNSVYEELVIVKKVTDKNGKVQVTLERKDGKKFFGYLKNVTANYTESIDAGEIVKVKP